VKIYLFNPETGFYLGEDFADEAPTGWGRCIVPSGATTVAPPEVGHGEVPVFDPAAGCWDVRPRPPGRADRERGITG